MSNKSIPLATPFSGRKSFQSTPCLDGHNPLNIEAWAGNVALNRIVFAESVYAEFCINAIRLGMGASAIASGRKPSMDRIRTRLARGAGVNVKVGSGVKVAVEYDV